MAKQVSYNKRENEKKKISKRLEKQKKKDSKKDSEKGKSFEDMIAYVDENGMLTETPPDRSNKTEIAVEDIVISIPKREKEDEMSVYTGTVEQFNHSRGFGFIRCQHDGNKYFCHISNCIDEITEGSKVSFEFEQGLRGLTVVNVKLNV